MGLFDNLKKQPQSPLAPEEQEQYQQQYDDPSSMMSAGLPPASMYGQPAPAFNEQMAELAIGTGITIKGVEVGSMAELPTLFYMFTDNWRHFQLTNIKAKDQRRIERNIKEIHRLSGQSGMEYLCKLKQIELLNTIYLFKSRSDLDDMRERKIWTLQTQAFQQNEAKRPKEGSSGFFSFLGTGNKGGRD